jgi:hypothetical protein
LSAAVAAADFRKVQTLSGQSADRNLVISRVFSAGTAALVKAIGADANAESGEPALSAGKSDERQLRKAEGRLVFAGAYTALHWTASSMALLRVVSALHMK